jgi:TusA-related sulfurtransferase/predicted peroxiredoxin
LIVSVESPTKTKGAAHRLDVRGRTITTAIALAAGEELSALGIGDELELVTDAFPAIVTDLEAWCRQTGHRLTDVQAEDRSFHLRLRKGVPQRNARQVAVVVSSDGLEELLSPLAFALAAALGGARVAVYIQGPAVHLLAPGFQAKLSGLGRPFSRFARAGMAKTGHVAPAEKLRQLQRLGGALYVCAGSLDHFRVDPSRLAFDDVVVCEYLTFMEVMQQADVQLYT